MGLLPFPNDKRSGRGEEGAALAIALIFILVVGIIITAALTKTGSILHTDYLVRQQAQNQYAVDAGVERALQVLRDDISSNPAHYCPTSTSPTTPMTATGDPNSKDPGGFAFNVNLTDSNSPHSPLKVRYSCKTTQGAVPDDTKYNQLGFSIVTTGGNAGGFLDDSLTMSNGAGTPLSVDGSVYVAGLEQTSDFQKNLTVVNGDFIEFDEGSPKACLTNVAKVAPTNGNGPVIVQTSPFTSTCGPETPIQAVPTFNLPTAPAAALPYANYQPVGATSPTCRVFFPGTYTGSAPNLLVPQGGGTPEANYFISGRYNFDGVGNWTIDNGALVFGGQPNSGASDVTALPANQLSKGVNNISKTGCKDFAGATDAIVRAKILTNLTLSTAPAGEWDYGTQFVMGGNSTLTMKSGALSLYTPPTSEGPASLIAARSAQWTPTGPTDQQQGYTPWHVPGDQALTGLQGNGQQVGFVANGEILGPDSPVSLAGTNGVTAAARAGIVGKTVDVNATASISGGNFYFNPFGGFGGKATPPQRRTIKIVACVDPANPAQDCTVTPTSTTFTETALATIDNFGNRPILVFSWHAG